MKPIAILNNGPIRRAKAEFYDACGGDFTTLLARTSGLPEAAFAEFDVELGDPLPDPRDFSAAILTGSPAMITDQHPWAEEEAAWVRRHSGRLPMLGICFGHQMLAHALGGKVVWMSSGPEYGTVTVTKDPGANDDPLFGGLAASFVAQAAHCQTVEALPPGATLLASGVTGMHAARYNQTTWGLQFHPELDVKVMRGLLSAYRDHYEEIGLDVDAGIAGLIDAPVATSVVRRFLELAGAGGQALAAE